MKPAHAAPTVTLSPMPETKFDAHRQITRLHDAEALLPIDGDPEAWARHMRLKPALRRRTAYP